MKKTYAVHPAIGIARVGDSLDDYFIGPEAPDVPPSLNKPGAPSGNGKYKDEQGRIKRQGGALSGLRIHARRFRAVD